MFNVQPYLFSAVVALVFGAVGCSGDKGGDSAGTADSGGTSGTDGGDGSEGGEPVAVTTVLQVSFDIDPDYRDVMEEDAIGGFWGDVYPADVVSSIGPDEGAVALASISVAEVDVRTAATGVLTEVGPIDCTEVTILGFLDSDANSTEGDRGPDDKDPVTLPGDNEFDCIEGVTPVTVYFGLLNP